MFYIYLKMKRHGVQKALGVSKQHSKTLQSKMWKIPTLSLKPHRQISTGFLPIHNYFKK